MALFGSDIDYWGEFPESLLNVTCPDLISPSGTWMDSLQATESEKVAASKLAFGIHFDTEKLSNDQWIDVVEKLKTYYGAVVKENNIPEKAFRVPVTAVSMLEKVSSNIDYITLHFSLYLGSNMIIPFFFSATLWMVLFPQKQKFAMPYATP